MPKDIADIGKKYTVAVNRVADGNKFYIVSSLNNSVYLSETPAAQEIKTLY